MKFLYKIDDWLAALEKALIVLFFSTLILMTTFNILTRNLFHVSYASILEYAPAFVVWLCLLGATIAFRRQGHIKLELLLRYCPERFGSVAKIASSLFGMFFMGVLFVTACEFVKNEVEFFGQRGWLATIFPLFFLLAFFRYLVRGVKYFESLLPSAMDPSITPDQEGSE